MFITTPTKFKCPYCRHEYEKIVGSGEEYRYKGKQYAHNYYNVCPRCGEDSLYSYDEKKYVKMPEDKEELELETYWMS